MPAPTTAPNLTDILIRFLHFIACNCAGLFILGVIAFNNHLVAVPIHISLAVTRDGEQAISCVDMVSALHIVHSLVTKLDV